MYLLDQDMTQRNEAFVIIKQYFGLLLKTSKSFEWRYHCYIFHLNDKKLSSHMDHICDQINSSHHIIHSYDKIRKIIVNLVSKKYKNNDTSTCELTFPQTLLLMSIVEIP